MVVVTLRDELPVNETIQLRQRLADEVDVNVTHIVLNQVFERPWKEGDDHEWLHLQKHVSGHAVLGPWLQQRCRWSDRQTFTKRDFAKLHLMLSLSQFGSTWSAARRWHLRLPRVSLSK